MESPGLLASNPVSYFCVSVSQTLLVIMQGNPLFLQIQLVMPENEAFIVCIIDAQYACHGQLYAVSPPKVLSTLSSCQSHLQVAVFDAQRSFTIPPLCSSQPHGTLLLYLLVRNDCFSFCSS